MTGFDTPVFKNVPVNERIRVQFGNPTTGVNRNTFGRIADQQNSPRDIQLAVELLY